MSKYVVGTLAVALSFLVACERPKVVTQEVGAEKKEKHVVEMPREDEVFGENTTQTPATNQSGPSSTAPAKDAPTGDRWLLGLVLPRPSAPPALPQPWLVEISGPEDARQAKMLDSALSVSSDIRDFTKQGDQVRFTLMLDDKPFAFQGIDAGKQIQGTLDMEGQITLAWLEPTNRQSVRGGPPPASPPGSAAFAAAQQAESIKHHAELLIEVIDQHSDSVIVFDAARELLQSAKGAELSREQVESVISKQEELAKAWGDRWSGILAQRIAYDLAAADAYPEIALQYAEKAREQVDENASEDRRRVTKLSYAMALLRNDRAEEAAEIFDELAAEDPDNSELHFYRGLAADKLGDFDAAIEHLIATWPHPLATKELERIWKTKHPDLTGLEERLDQAYLERYPPIIVDAYAARTPGEDHQVLLAELFTGTSCPPCVAADVAFEALGRAFQPSELVLLQYHLHIPGPDPLTNADSQARAKYYNIPGTPALFLGGKQTSPTGGPRAAAPDKYTELRTAIEKQLDAKSIAKIELSAQRDGDKVDIVVKVSDIPQPGESLKLRVALLEETVRFTGSNGVRLHHAVVRAMPGGAEGVAVTEAATSQTFTVDLNELRESLRKQLADVEREVSVQNDVDFQFPAKPLDLEKLKVAAFLQEDGSQNVVQAASAPVKTKQ